jgi:transcriptional regulator with XRE-family HTH domain
VCAPRVISHTNGKAALDKLRNMSTTLKQELLQRAAGFLTRKELVTALGVSESLLDAWLRGDVATPDGKLLVVAALLHGRANQKQ